MYYLVFFQPLDPGQCDIFCISEYKSGPSDLHFIISGFECMFTNPKMTKTVLEMSTSTSTQHVHANLLHTYYSCCPVVPKKVLKDQLYMQHAVNIATFMTEIAIQCVVWFLKFKLQFNFYCVFGLKRDGAFFIRYHQKHGLKSLCCFDFCNLVWSGSWDFPDFVIR